MTTTISKLLFLDVDGVLNNAYTKEKVKLFTGLDKRLVKLFTDWFSTRDYLICLSSTWRTDVDFKHALTEAGISWCCETPVLTSWLGYQVCRGHEIEAVLAEKQPLKYAILDDMGPSEFLKHQRQYLVQTSYVTGVTQKKFDQIDKILGAQHELVSQPVG